MKIEKVEAWKTPDGEIFATKEAAKARVRLLELIEIFEEKSIHGKMAIKDFFELLRENKVSIIEFLNGCEDE